MAGLVVKTFLVDGEPEGLRTMELSNATVLGTLFPRPALNRFLARPASQRPGVYILLGAESEADELEAERAYIGEGDPVGYRLSSHAKQKDFWTHAVIFTSKDQNLNKAHVQRLEARLVELARSSKRCILENSNIPQAPSLSEADTAEVESFLDDLLLCLPILGYGFFEAAPAAEGRTVQFVLKGKGIEARGFESAKGFVVRAGSQAVREDKEAPSIRTYLKETRAELVRQGVLVDRGKTYEVSQNYTFSSPSTAAGVLLGRSSNGRIEWKTPDGRTLKSIQDEQVSG